MSEGPLDSGLKSVDTGALSPDRTPGSGINGSTAQQEPRVEVLVDSNWTIKPFKVENGDPED